MRRIPPFRSEPRWLPLCRSIAPWIVGIGAAITATVWSLWFTRPRPYIIELARDSVAAFYPVCEAGPILWFPQRARVP